MPQQPGEGLAMAGAHFRDPTDVEVQASALRQSIAQILVNAPALPVDVPAFDLTLLSVGVERGAVDLIFGKDSPIAKLRLKSAPATAVEGSSAVDVSVIPIHRSNERFDRAFDQIRARLEAAVTHEKWERASARARELALLPTGIPLTYYRQLVPGVAEQALIRTGFNCNQDCGICWQDRDWGRFSGEQVMTWIEDLYAAGARQLIISGGEPTLDRMLVDYIALARGLGFRAITLESNAIQFSKGGLAERLRDAGLSDCFISLHSADAATSDAITRAPGTFVRTIAGIKALLAADVPVRLNCVMTAEGISHLPELPDFIDQTFGKHPCLQGLMLSQPADPFDETLLRAIVPHPAEVRAALRAVIDRAFALHIEISGLDGPCGPPLCAFGADPRIASLRPISETLASRTYLAACDVCGVRSCCFGVRAADAALYGDACVSPLPR